MQFEKKAYLCNAQKETKRAPHPARMVELVDTQAWGACVRFRTCRFKSCFGHWFSKTVDPIAQSVEHFTFNERALGSSPSWITDRAVNNWFTARFFFYADFFTDCFRSVTDQDDNTPTPPLSFLPAFPMQYVYIVDYQQYSALKGTTSRLASIWECVSWWFLAPFSACTSILESKSKCNFLNIKMRGTKTCKKCCFLMRKGTKMVLKPRATLWLFCEVFSIHLIGINRVL